MSMDEVKCHAILCLFGTYSIGQTRKQLKVRLDFLSPVLS